MSTMFKILWKTPFALTWSLQNLSQEILFYSVSKGFTLLGMHLKVSPYLKIENKVVFGTSIAKDKECSASRLINETWCITWNWAPPSTCDHPLFPFLFNDILIIIQHFLSVNTSYSAKRHSYCMHMMHSGVPSFMQVCSKVQWVWLQTFGWLNIYSYFRRDEVPAETCCDLGEM